jgi:hypothetical protein
MSGWANKGIRKQREDIVMAKHQCGWSIKTISSYIGIAPGSVIHIIKKHTSLGGDDVSTTSE